MAAQLIDAVREAADLVDVDVDAESQFQVQPYVSEVTFSEVHLDDLSLEAVDYDGDYLVAQTQLVVLAEIRTYFEFSAQDPIDRDDMPLGSGRATTKKELSVDLLITFSGDLLRDPQIEQVEVLPVRTRVRYTELEPSWMNEPDDGEA